MAGETKIKEASHSKTLFTDDHNAPIIFFMRPCSERQFLRPLIEYGGGKITSKGGPDCIKLAEKGCTVTSDGYISTQFIEDCVKMNTYLEPSDYSVRPGTIVREDSEKSFSSNDSMSPASTIIKTSVSSGKGRQKYTKTEDVSMINYIVTERRYRETSGIRLWKDMELLGVTNHSAESMNTRYRKNILPNIENYKGEIPAKWISLLTGNTTREKEPEFSADALFKPRSKIPTPTKKKDGSTTSQYFSSLFPKKAAISPAKQNRNVFADLCPPKPSRDNSYEENIKDEQNKNNIDTNDRNSQKKKHADKDSKTNTAEAEELSTEGEERQLRKRPQLAAADQESPRKVGRVENAEPKESPIKKQKMLAQKDKSNKTEDLRNDDSESEELVNSVEPRQLRKREVEKLSQSKDKGTAVGKNKTNEIVKWLNGQKPVAGQDDLEAFKLTDSNELQVRNLRKRPQNETSNERSPSKKHSLEKKSESACEDISSPAKNKREITSKEKIHNDGEISKGVERNKQKEMGSDNSNKEKDLKHIKSYSNGNPSSSNTNNDSKLSRLERKKRLDIVLKRIDGGGEDSTCTAELDVTCEEARSGKTQHGDRKSRRKQSGKIDKMETGEKLVTASDVDTDMDEDIDNFDKMLVDMAEEDSKTKTSSNKSNRDKENRGNIKKTSETSSSIVNAGTDRERITRSAQKTSQQTCKGPADSTTDNVFSFNSDTEEDEAGVNAAVMECRRLFKNIAKHFGLPSEYVRKLLYRNNGHVNRTICWIKFGPYSPYPPSWETNDDRCLVHGEEQGRLICKFGALDVAERIKFLGHESAAYVKLVLNPYTRLSSGTQICIKNSPGKKNTIVTALIFLSWSAEASVKDCTFKDESTGKVYDFSSLISPNGYTFNQQVWQINGFGLDSLSADEQVNITLHVQVCRNFVVPPLNCKDIGALYTVTSDGKCTSWGNANVSIFDPNPYKDGVNLKMYHGTQIDHLSYNSGTIYFVCNKGDNGVKDETLTFEHVKTSLNQAHFKFFTHLAC